MVLCPKDTDCVCPTTDNCWWQGSMYQQSGLQLLLLMPHGESLVDIQFLDSFTILMVVLMIVPCWTHFVHFGVFIVVWMRMRIPLLKLFVCWVALWLERMHVSFHQELVWTVEVECSAWRDRLRITLSAAHTTADVEALVVALSPWIKTTCSSPSYHQYATQRFNLSLPKEISQTLPQNHMIGMPSQGRQGKHYTKAGILFIQPKL